VKAKDLLLATDIGVTPVVVTASLAVISRHPLEFSEIVADRHGQSKQALERFIRRRKCDRNSSGDIDTHPQSGEFLIQHGGWCFDSTFGLRERPGASLPRPGPSDAGAAVRNALRRRPPGVSGGRSVPPGPPRHSPQLTRHARPQDLLGSPGTHLQ